ncbi:hypothetical protein PR048_017586 [Dryococelus australis]|uniref:Uncharacterized protein n=1 Tax=Dryococelus australis TaxID=614101 RepID=A0ABQ9H9X1_9NEOP|nr:hypothetical protein PR048_017586 [Dryococelus australis]
MLEWRGGEVGRYPHAKNSGSTPQKIEPCSLWWEASSLTTTPPSDGQLTAHWPNRTPPPPIPKCPPLPLPAPYLAHRSMRSARTSGELTEVVIPRSGQGHPHIKWPPPELINPLLAASTAHPTAPDLAYSTRIPLKLVWGSVGMKGRGKWDIPKKTCRPTSSFGTIPTCENPVTRPGIEPGAPWWEARRLVTDFRQVCSTYERRLNLMFHSKRLLRTKCLWSRCSVTMGRARFLTCRRHKGAKCETTCSRVSRRQIINSDKLDNESFWPPLQISFHNARSYLLPASGTRRLYELQERRKVVGQRVYTEVTFAIGSEFITHALDDSGANSRLVREQEANPILPGVRGWTTEGAATEQTSEARLYKGLWSQATGH